MSRHFDVNKIKNSEPEYCWVGDVKKVCYKTREEAEIAARVAEYDHNLATKLSVYKCEYKNHWHLSSKA